MNRTILSFFKFYVFSTLFWVSAFLLFILIRYNGLENELLPYLDEELMLPTRAFYEFALALGIITGFVYTIIETIADLLANKFSLGLIIIIKSMIYFIIMVVLLSFASILIEIEIDIDLPNEGDWWTTNQLFWNTILFFVVASIIFQLIRLAIARFGQGNFLTILLGTYKRPKEEERLLMFIDLKDSTAIAESLGHHVYSEFIQDCFVDLDSVLRRYNAKVYQYVGDEVVIHWAPKKGFKNNNCIQLFYAFGKRLKKRERYYGKKYKILPKFKAGIHYGKIMVAEVGSYKKELAFHGDVINTAARLQGCCNEFGKRLLISEDVLNKLNISKTHYELMERDMKLRGKEKSIKIYAIDF